MKKQKIQEEISYFNSQLSNMEQEVFNFSKLRVYSKYFNFDNMKDIEILEIGGGLGKFSFWLADRFPKIKIISTDINDTLIKKANDINKYKNLKFQCANCEKLPFPDKCFDIVFGVGILHHLPSIEKTVSEIKRVLRTNKQTNKQTKTTYIGIEPNFYNLYNLFRIKFWPKEKTVNERPIFISEIRNIFQKNDFKVNFEFLFPRFPSIKNKILSSCVNIVAEIE